MIRIMNSGLLRAWSALPVTGHDPASSARALAFFRRHGCDIVPLDHLFKRPSEARLGEGIRIKVRRGDRNDILFHHRERR
jgi:hypothetical protein